MALPLKCCVQHFASLLLQKGRRRIVECAGKATKIISHGRAWMWGCVFLTGEGEGRITMEVYRIIGSISGNKQLELQNKRSSWVSVCHAVKLWNSDCVLQNIIDSRSLPGFQIKPECFLFLALEVLGPQIVEDCKRILRKYCYMLALFFHSSLGICCCQRQGTGQGGALIRPGTAISDLLSAFFDCPFRTAKGWQIMFFM